MKFPNDACTATNGLIGTCLTSTECTSRYEISNLVLNKRNIQFGIEQNVFSKSLIFESRSYLCYARSGTSGGNCAAGFGVCCLGMTSCCIEFKNGLCLSLNPLTLFSVYTASCTTLTEVSQNNTYLRNPSYPSAYPTSTSTTTCGYKISKAASTVCQLRLDYETLVLGQTAATGVCTDSLATTTTADNSVT